MDQQDAENRPAFRYIPKRTPYYIETKSNGLLEKIVEERQQVLLYGPLGIGKTEGVLYYLEKEKFAYRQALWLDFAKEEIAEASMISCLGLRARSSEEDLRTLILQLSSCLDEDSIVIFDNVNDEDMLNYLTSIPFRCRFIITSHKESCCSCLHRDASLRWKELDIEETKELLTEIIGSEKVQGFEQELTTIARKCEGIPLVAIHVGFYIRTTHCSLPYYLRLCKERLSLELGKSKWSERKPWEKNINAYQTFYLAYEKLCINTPEKDETVKLFHFLLFLNPSALSEEMLYDLSGLSMNDFNESMGDILKYFLFVRQDGKIIMKQVVQDIVRSYINKEQKAEAVLEIGRKLGAFFMKLPASKMFLAQYTEVALHAVHLIDVARMEELKIEKEAELLQGIGWYYYLYGLYNRALDYLQKASQLAYSRAEQNLYLRICGELGELYEAMGDDEKAERELAKARPKLQDLKQMQPLTAAQILTVDVYLHENRGMQFEYEQALQLLEEINSLLADMGPEEKQYFYLQAEVARINILNELDRYKEADATYKAVTEALPVSGLDKVDHPAEISLYGSRGNTLFALGELEPAREYYQRQFSLCQKLYWSELHPTMHPTMVYACINIAATFSKEKEFLMTENWVEKAEETMCRLDLKHGELTFHILCQRAIAEYNQGKYESFSLTCKKLLDCEIARPAWEAKWYLWLAFAEYGLHHWEEAEGYINKACEAQKKPGVVNQNAELFLQQHESFVRLAEDGGKIQEIIQIIL